MIRTGLIWSAGAIAVMLGTLYWAFGALPAGEQIPVHWGPDGTADRFADKDGALLEPFFGGGPISQLPVHLIVTGDGVIRYQLAADLPTDIADKVTLWLSE